MRETNVVLIEPVAEGALPGIPIATPYGMEEIPFGLFALGEGCENPPGSQSIQKATHVLLMSSLRNYRAAVAKASFETTLLCRRARKNGCIISSKQFTQVFASLLAHQVVTQPSDPTCLARLVEDVSDLFLVKGECVWVVGLTDSSALVVCSDLEIEAVPLSCLDLNTSSAKELTKDGIIYDSSNQTPALPERLHKLLTELEGG